MDTKDVLEKYRRKIEDEVKNEGNQIRDFSREYSEFRKETIPDFTRYERWCNTLGNIISLRASEKDRAKISRHLEIAHLNVTPSQALSLAVFTFLGIFFFTFLLSAAIYLLFPNFPLTQLGLIFFLGVVVGVFVYYYVMGMPERLAMRWRLKASSQMVPAILYVVVYMRHTSNLERAIGFAAEHLHPPLSLDLRKVFYDVQVGKYSTIKESLDHYLETWRDFSPEFVESFHLIESSLFEPSEELRVQILEKSLQTVLDGVYDRMLKFTHDVRSPLTNVYMLGVVLPTLGLALLPLASTLLKGLLQWYHVFIIFNLIIPFFVFYMTNKIMLQRPGGYGETELLELNPLYARYKDNSVYWIALILVLPLLIIGLIPLIFGFTPVPQWLGLAKDFKMSDIGLGIFGQGDFFRFFENGAGPFGVGALVLSLFIPLGIAMFFVYSYRHKTKEIIKNREYTKSLEYEFNNSLFQLGNRLGSGIPAEIVFAKVAESSKGMRTEDFFRRVNYNIQQNGMSVENALFDRKRGAIIYYPSQLIATSMRILVESVKKGLRIAARSLMSISEYVKNIQKINERLRDLLAEVVSDMKSNITFLAPILSGVVVALAAMITTILDQLKALDVAGADVGNLKNLLNIFDVSQMIPPYFLQISVGIYLIQIIFILTNTLVTIDSGEDKLERTNKTASHLMIGMTLYFIVALVGALVLSLLASIVLGGFGG